MSRRLVPLGDPARDPRVAPLCPAALADEHRGYDHRDLARSPGYVPVQRKRDARLQARAGRRCRRGISTWNVG